MKIHSILAALMLAMTVSVPAKAFQLSKIPNGIETKEHPQVVRLDIGSFAMCSGTIVGTNTVLTAAHCMEDVGAPSSIKITSGDQKFRANGYMVHPLANREEWNRVNDIVNGYDDWSDLSAKEKAAAQKNALFVTELTKYDLALVMFEAEENPNGYLPVRIIDQETSFLNLLVTLVGFGKNDNTAWFFDGAGTKRMGTNTIRGTWHGIISIAGLIRDRVYKWGGLKTEADGKEVGIGSGDSGGTMMIDNQVIGVNVASLSASVEFETFRQAMGKQGEELYQLHKKGREWGCSVNLSHPDNVKFLKEAADLGYKISFVR